MARTKGSMAMATKSHTEAWCGVPHRRSPVPVHGNLTSSKTFRKQAHGTCHTAEPHARGTNECMPLGRLLTIATC